MTTFATGQLTRHLSFGAAVLASGVLTTLLTAAGTSRAWGAPEFLTFARRTGWTLIASGAIWEAVAGMKLLLRISETPPSGHIHKAG